MIPELKLIISILQSMVSERIAVIEYCIKNTGSHRFANNT